VSRRTRALGNEVDNMRSRILRLCALLFLSFIGVEAGLRMAGRLFYLLNPERPATGRPVILCVGESTTQGLWTEAGESYPEQLEALLTARFGERRYDVLKNHEGVGANTAMILERLPEILREHDPVAVIYMVGVNNLWNLAHTHIALWSHNDSIGRLLLGLSAIADHFRTFKLLRMMKQRWFPTRPAEAAFPQTVEARAFAAQHVGLFHDILLHDLRRMVALARENNATPLLMTYPFGEWRDAQAEVAREMNVPLIDNGPAFAAIKRHGDLHDYVFAADNWHPNKAGYAIIADNALRGLVSAGVLPATADER
jgi:lysophospholipase L1-like esterase